MRYAFALVLAVCVAGCRTVGDDLHDCWKAGMAENWDAAAPACTKAAKKGEPFAQVALGLMHEDGLGVPLDYGKAVEWYTKAAMQGHPPAQTNLGNMHLNGLGVPQNLPKAVEWYTKAGNQGHAEALLNLGGMYQMGRGVPQSNYKAYFWYNLAATIAEAPWDLWFPERQEEAANLRDWLAKQITPQEIAEAERTSSEWLEKFKARQKDE